MTQPNRLPLQEKKQTFLTQRRLKPALELLCPRFARFSRRKTQIDNGVSDKFSKIFVRYLEGGQSLVAVLLSGLPLNIKSLESVSVEFQTFFDIASERTAGFSHSLLNFDHGPVPVSGSSLDASQTG